MYASSHCRTKSSAQPYSGNDDLTVIFNAFENLSYSEQ